MKKAERRISSSLINSQLRHLLQTLSGGIAHNFNNILTPILGYSELIHDEVKDGFLKEAIKEIIYSSKTASQLIEELLFFCQKQVTDFKTIDLIKILDDFITNIPKEKLIGIKINVDVEEELPQVKGDEKHIRKLFQNLFDNAVKAMPDGGILTVRMKSRKIEEDFISGEGVIKKGDYLYIKFIDSGVGMNSFVKERIFEPFFTTRQVGEGHGLGLAVVLGVIKEHNGEIVVSSERDIGTQFELFFPIHSNKKSNSEKMPKEYESAENPKNVALFLRNSEMQKYLDVILRECSCQTLVVNHFKDFRPIIRQNEVHLLIIDQTENMKEIIQCLKLNEKTKVLFLCDWSDSHLIASSNLPKWINTLGMPFDLKSIIEKLEQLL